MTNAKGVLPSIRIQAMCRRARDHDNVAAINPSASRSWDAFDLPEPPVIGDYVSIYFPHRDWQNLSKNFCTDFRPEFTDGEIWEFEVKTNIRDAVKLTFAGIESVPGKFEVWLVDDALNITQNLRELSRYSVAGASEQNPKRLQLVVGTPAFIRNKLASAQQIPDNFELSQNFPNPFNPVTTIRYGLPQDSNVTLKIYNILGEQVVTLISAEPRKAGYHTALWNGRNNAGMQVASGVYVYRIRAGDFVAARKMALLR